MDYSSVTLDAIVITIIYAVLILWGVWVGWQQVNQGFRHPEQLLNPLFGNRQAIQIFTFHLIVVSLDLFVCGPLALHYKSRLWYWGGRVALLTSSFPLAFYFNRTPESFGKLIGTWIRFRNYFEIALHVLVSAIAVNWFYYYGLLYWLVAYRYLDVGPRRLIQTFYNTPAKRDARPWAPMLNWVVITAIYVLTAVAVYYRKVIFAAPPDPARPEHVPSLLEGILVVGINVGIAMFGWGMTRRYTGPGPAAELIPVVGGDLTSRAEAPAAEPKG
jgi:hypothetical protein